MRLMSIKSTIFTLKEGGDIRLDGLQLIKVVNVGQPILKATVDAQILKGNELCIYNDNNENWEELQSPVNIVIGVGDKILVGNVMIMVTSLSKKHQTVRLSLRTEDVATFNQIRRAAGK